MWYEYYMEIQQPSDDIRECLVVRDMNITWKYNPSVMYHKSMIVVRDMNITDKYKF